MPYHPNALLDDVEKFFIIAKGGRRGREREVIERVHMIDKSQRLTIHI